MNYLHHKAVLLISTKAYEYLRRNTHTQPKDQTGCDLPPPPPSRVLLAERQKKKKSLRNKTCPQTLQELVIVIVCIYKDIFF